MDTTLTIILWIVCIATSLSLLSFFAVPILLILDSLAKFLKPLWADREEEKKSLSTLGTVVTMELYRPRDAEDRKPARVKLGRVIEYEYIEWHGEIVYGEGYSSKHFQKYEMPIRERVRAHNLRLTGPFDYELSKYLNRLLRDKNHLERRREYYSQCPAPRPE